MDNNRHNIAVLTVVEGFWGFQAAMVYPSTVLAVLLQQYGASGKMIGSISAIEAGTIVLPQIFGIFLFKSSKRRKKHMFLWHLLIMTPMIFATGGLIFCQKYLPYESMKWLLLLLFGLFNFCIGIILAVWQDWIAKVFVKEIRGTAMGISLFFSSGAGFFGAYLAGQVLNSMSGTKPYGILYLIAGVFALISSICISLIKDKATLEEDKISQTDLSLVFSKFAESMKHPNFRSFLFGRLLSTAGFCILPFLAIYYMSKDGGELSGGTVISCSAAQTVGMAIGNIVFGKTGDRYGHRIGIITGILMQFLALCILIFSHGSMSCILAYFTIGLSIASSIISHSNMVFETCPHDNRLAHITVGSLVLSGGSIGFPLLAGTIASCWGLNNLFMISAAISVAALFWMIFKVREPREDLFYELPGDK